MIDIPEIKFEEEGVVPAMKKILKDEIMELYRLGMWDRPEYVSVMIKYIELESASKKNSDY
jgi:hypothetical protein